MVKAKITSESKINFEVLGILNLIDNSAMLFNEDFLLNTSKAGDIILRYDGTIFNKKFAVFDLNNFIDAFKIFESFDYKFKDESLVFKSAKDKKTFTYSLGGKNIEEDLMEDLEPALEHIDSFREKVEDESKRDQFFSFEFTPDVVKELKQVSSKFGLKDLMISFKKGKKQDKIMFRLMNIDLKDQRGYDVEPNVIKDSEFDRDIEFFIDINNLIDMMAWDCYYFDETEDVYLISHDKKYDMTISHLTDDDFEYENDDLVDEE